MGLASSVRIAAFSADETDDGSARIRRVLQSTKCYFQTESAINPTITHEILHENTVSGNIFKKIFVFFCVNTR